jgi:hypothetical protein
MLTGKTVARIGFVLFGVYLLVRFFSSLIDGFAKNANYPSGDGTSLTATLTSPATMASDLLTRLNVRAYSRVQIALH